MKTCILTTDTYLNHDTGQGHPERANRVTVIIDHLKKLKSKDLIWKKPTKFDLEYLAFAHDKNYLDNVKDSFPKQGLNFLDGDTIVSPGSKEATRDAVGSILTAIDGVMKKDFNNAFCAVRPPGHHAEKQKAMGFCVYNNIAVGAYYLLEKYNLKKVAIIDFDVHHGNGTQDIFYDNEKVLYISTHQYPYYPGTGKNSEKGKYNNVLNIPLPAGTGSREYLDAFEHALKKGADYIIEMDSDYSHHPKYIPTFLKEIQNSDVVIGSRNVEGGKELGRSGFREFITWFANLYIRIIMRINVKDCTSGYRCFRRRALESIRLEKMVSKGPSIVEEILYACHLKKFRIKEIPIVFEDRTRGDSTKNLCQYIDTAWKTLQFRFKM